MKREASTPLRPAAKRMKEMEQKFAKAGEEMRRRLPTPSEAEEQEIKDAYARQNEELKKPSLVDRQQAALNARAQRRFGVDATFTDAFPTLKKDMVVPIVLRYTNGYTPQNPSMRDVRQAVGGGYPQQYVELTLAKLTADMYGHLIEAEFERPTLLSYRNGSTERTDYYALCKDGTVRYFNDGWREWTHHVPRWEFADLPLVQPMCVGFEL